jgi:hypothetical protein
MPLFASDMGISPTNPRFSYSVIAFDGSGSAGETVPGTGYFNAAFFYRKLIACRIRPSLDGGFTNSAERCDLAASRSSAPRP